MDLYSIKASEELESGWLRAHTTLAEDPNLVRGTYTGQLTAARHPVTLAPAETPVALTSTCTQVHIPTLI